MNELNIDEMNLKSDFEISINLHLNNILVRGYLKVDSQSIRLYIYNIDINVDFSYDVLTCDYGNYTLDLITLEAISLSNDFVLNSNDAVFNVSKILVKEYNVNRNLFNKIVINSIDINHWVGFTEQQRNYGFEVKEKLFINTIEEFKKVECSDFNFIINYRISTLQDSIKGVLEFKYLPEFEIVFNTKKSYEETLKIYHQFLDFFHLIIGYNLNIEKVYFENNEKEYNRAFLYYKQEFKNNERGNVFISLANNLVKQYRKELDLTILNEYFLLSDYNKSFYTSFRKYKMFQYSEEKFLGYYRILENIMFCDEEITDEQLLELRNEESLERLSDFHLNKCKKKRKEN